MTATANDALLRTIEPIIEELGLSVESCDVSDEKLLIKMVSPRLTGAVKVNDHVQAGLIVRNSEVRCSAVEVDWFVKRLVCLNGMVCNGPNGRGAFRRHVGRDWNMPRRKSRCAGSHNGASLNGSALNGNSPSGVDCQRRFHLGPRSKVSHNISWRNIAPIEGAARGAHNVPSQS